MLVTQLTTRASIQFLTGNFVGAMFLGMFETYETCDGLIISSPEAYEPAAVAAIKEWFAETSRPVWAIGPLFPKMASPEAVAGEATQSESWEGIKEFLDAALTAHGEHSLLYVSHTYWEESITQRSDCHPSDFIWIGLLASAI